MIVISLTGKLKQKYQGVSNLYVRRNHQKDFDDMKVLFSFLCFLLLNLSKARVREYCIAAVEIEWNYAPNGNKVNENSDNFNKFLKPGPDRIGSAYKKIVYREYTDKTFTKQIPHDASLGIVGPIIHAEEGDTIKVLFKNMAMTAGRNFSMHPHGVQYDKDSEGALYVDATTGKDKDDEGVMPGSTFMYMWRVTDNFAPTRDDSKCLSWAYHSHVSSVKDVDSGLVGVLLTCRKGRLRFGRRGRNVDKEFFLYMDQTNEGESWLFQQNLAKCGNPATCTSLSNNNDPSFRTSNLLFHVNGYMYGNLPGLDVIQGDDVIFHFLSLNTGIQSAHFSGQVVTVRNHRMDTVTFYPASFVSAHLTAQNLGSWLLSSRIAEAFDGGMHAFLNVKRRNIWRGRRDVSLFESPRVPQGYQKSKFWQRTRRYYIAAELVDWDYAPSGKDLYGQGGNLTEDSDGVASQYFTRGPNRIGGTYRKAVYVEYTNASFRKKKPPQDEDKHRGFLGPVIKAEEGETVLVTFKNNADREYSIFPHGLTFTKENEGFLYKDPQTNQMKGKVAKPGQRITYKFRVPRLSSPTRNDLPCVTHTYHSAADPVRDVHAGLTGPLLVCNRGQLRKRPTGFLWSKGRQSTWYSRLTHFYVLFMTIDENRSWYIDHNIQTYTSDPASVDKTDAGFFASNRMHAINGRMFGNLQGLDACLEDRIAWHIIGFGGWFDMHGVNFDGQTLTLLGNKVEGKEIIPGSEVTLLSQPDRIGKWSLVCRTNFHFRTGMVALYDVKACGERETSFQGQKIRKYFIAAEEVDWDYAPLKRDLVTGENFTDDTQPGYFFVKNDDHFIGSTYKKAVYREYTDASFTTRKPRTANQEHLGILGPVMRAEVGDVIEVVFKNMASTRAFSIHPQGVRYDKANEGSLYKDGTNQKADDGVLPGQSFKYRWEVPSRAGPGKNDPNCISWMYYSSVDSVKDMNSGLVGPLVICSRGTFHYDDKRYDVDREFALLFSVFDENESWYLQDNVERFAPERTDLGDATFRASNSMNSINGRIYGNLKGLLMDEGDCVDWYLLGLGSTFDYHPVHFHGQTFVHKTDKAHRSDVIEVFPSTTQTVQMLTDNPGTWILHCHFSAHVKSGMEVTYTIRPAP